MKNWKKGILGVALSFMFLFTCVGYAALTDTLSITGTVSATMPEEIFISEIELVSGSASITGLTQITVTEAGVFEITVCNNTSDKYVYTGASLEITVKEAEDGADIETVRETTDAYVAGTNLKQIDPKTTDGPTCVKMYVTYDSAGVIDFNFKEFIYKISYINNEIELDTRYVFDNSQAVSAENDVAKAAAMAGIVSDSITFKAWINAGSTVVTSIDAENTEDIELFPSYNNWYTAIFVTQSGELLAWTMFTTDQKTELLELADETQKLVLETDDLTFDYWVVQVKNADGTDSTNTLDEYTSEDELPANDITIYPAYKYNGDVNLIPIDSDGDGDIEYYQVGGYNEDTGGQSLVVIPAEVNGVNVTEINADAFSSYDDLHSVVIPSTVTTIGATAFADGKVLKEYPWGGTYETTGTETVTLYYQGSCDDWNKITKNDGWDDNLGLGSRVFFLGDDGKVDPDKGYIELCNQDYDEDAWFSDWSSVTQFWTYHNHPYPDADLVSNGQHTYNDTLCTADDGDPQFHFATWTDYDGVCGCSSCEDGALRPDAEYWTETTTSEEETS